MYVNLLRQKAYHRLTDDDMGKIIGVSRNTYNQKLRNGRFWPNVCILINLLIICLQQRGKRFPKQAAKRRSVTGKILESVSHRSTGKRALLSRRIDY